MSETTIGQIIDGLEVSPSLDEGDLVASALLLLEIVEPDGDTRLSIAWSDGMSWLKRTGMLHHALAKEDE